MDNEFSNRKQLSSQAHAPFSLSLPPGGNANGDKNSSLCSSIGAKIHKP
jgi:hypothetical protein